MNPSEAGRKLAHRKEPKEQPGKTLVERTCKKNYGGKSPGTVKHTEETETRNGKEVIHCVAQIL